MPVPSGEKVTSGSLEETLLQAWMWDSVGEAWGPDVYCSWPDVVGDAIAASYRVSCCFAIMRQFSLSRSSQYVLSFLFFPLLLHLLLYVLDPVGHLRICSPTAAECRSENLGGLPLVSLVSRHWTRSLPSKRNSSVSCSADMRSMRSRFCGPRWAKPPCRFQ